MKSILFLIPTLCLRGAERVLVNLVNNLDKRKYRVTVQTLFDVGENRALLNGDVEYKGGLPFLLHGNVTMFKLFSPKWLYDRIVGRKQYDIVVAYLEGPATRIISGCPFPGTKKIAWVHVQQGTKEMVSCSYRSYGETVECYKQFDRVVCVSESVKQDFESLLPFKATVLYNVNEDAAVCSLAKECVDDVEFPSDTFNIVSVGKLDKQKGFDRLVKVHARLRMAGLNVNTFVLGSGAERKSLEVEIKRNDAEESFHLLGCKSNPYKYMAKADLYVCSSKFEGFSTAMTDAAYLGLPIVSTNCGGAYELLGQNDEYGIVTENSDEALYCGVHKMLTMPGALEHYRQCSIDRGRLFNKRRALLKNEEFFDSL